MSAKDYPINFPFGATSAPYSPASPHKGEDRIMPVNTPVVVNGVQIGLSGNTGYSSGAHLHIGKFTQNGTLMAPLGQGFYFNNARVITVGSDSTNGNYVRLLADSYYYVYCHLNRQTCSVGQVLIKPTEDLGIMNEQDAKDVYRTLLHREPENDQVWRSLLGRRFSDVAAGIRESEEWQGQTAKINQSDSLRQNVTDLQSQLTTVNKSLADLQVVDTADKQALQEALSQVNVQSAKLAATVVMVAPVKLATSTILPANKPSLLQVIKLLFSKS